MISETYALFIHSFSGHANILHTLPKTLGHPAIRMEKSQKSILSPAKKIVYILFCLLDQSIERTNVKLPKSKPDSWIVPILLITALIRPPVECCVPVQTSLRPTKSSERASANKHVLG